jgi:hypothetical protein
MTSSLSDIFGTFLSAVFYEKYGVRIAFLICISFTLVGGLMIIFLHTFTSFMPVFIMFAKIGTSSTFNLVFLANSDLFPTLFSATAIGICNFFARILTISAP